MPELPEVEVLRLSLEPRLVGERIEDVDVRQRQLREPVDPRALVRDCRGRRVQGLRRRAKYLLIDLEAGSTLVVHLGMSGRLTLAVADAPPEPHQHVTFQLASGRRLRFRDPRRFGLVFSMATTAMETDRHFLHLGAEPLAEGFDGAFLQAAAAGRRGPVKAFLMDARIVVGIGNIYASEALWQARIHPGRSVGRIGSGRWDELAESVRRVLANAIAQGGTTLNDFADGDGQAGYFQVSLSAYDREGKHCPRCGRTIRRLVQAGRSSFYCPGCQR